MKVSHHSTSNTSLNCVLKTGKIAKGHSFPITMTENWDLASKQIACNSNLIDEITGVIKEFLEIDRYTKNLISRVNHVLSMLVNLSLAIGYGPSLRSGPNRMVLVKGLPTYT